MHCYADDMVIITDGTTLEKKLLELEEYMQKYGLKINRKKTKTLWLNNEK